MKETKNSQKATATESKNSSNRRTVKNNKSEETMKKTATTAAAPKKGAAAKKNSSPKTGKKSEKQTRTNAGRVENHITKAKEERRGMIAQEEKDLQKQREKLQKDEERAAAAAEKAEAAAAKKEVKDRFTGAKLQTKIVLKTPCHCFHWLNNQATAGNYSGTEVKTTDLLWTYEKLNSLTPTANDWKGYSYNNVKVNYKGEVCKMMKYTPDNRDERQTVKFGKYMEAEVITTEQYQNVEIREYFAGEYILIPVNVTYTSILDATKSYVEMYTETEQNMKGVNLKKVMATKDETKAERARKRAEKALKAAEEAAAAAKEEEEKAAKKVGIFDKIRRIAALF